MAVELVLLNPDGDQRAFPVSRARIIGREEDCDMRIPVAEVSREHCRVEPSSNGGLEVEDLGSSNGTYINGMRIEEAEMAAGDILKIGPAIMVLRVDGQPAAIDADEAILRGTPSEHEAQAPASQPQASKQVGQGSLLDEDDEDMFSDFDFDDDDDDEAPKL
ncbi:MAG: FHA domain-containing protein [Phycisphaerales bacterium]